MKNTVVQFTRSELEELLRGGTLSSEYGPNNFIFRMDPEELKPELISEKRLDIVERNQLIIDIGEYNKQFIRDAAFDKKMLLLIKDYVKVAGELDILKSKESISVVESFIDLCYMAFGSNMIPHLKRALIDNTYLWICCPTCLEKTIIIRGLRAAGFKNMLWDESKNGIFCLLNENNNDKYKYIVNELRNIDFSQYEDGIRAWVYSIDDRGDLI